MNFLILGCVIFSGSGLQAHAEGASGAATQGPGQVDPSAGWVYSIQRGNEARNPVSGVDARIHQAQDVNGNISHSVSRFVPGVASEFGDGGRGPNTYLPGGFGPTGNLQQSRESWRLYVPFIINTQSKTPWDAGDGTILSNRANTQSLLPSSGSDKRISQAIPAPKILTGYLVDRRINSQPITAGRGSSPALGTVSYRITSTVCPLPAAGQVNVNSVKCQDLNQKVSNDLIGSQLDAAFVEITRIDANKAGSEDGSKTKSTVLAQDAK